MRLAVALVLGTLLAAACAGPEELAEPETVPPPGAEETGTFPLDDEDTTGPVEETPTGEVGEAVAIVVRDGRALGGAEEITVSQGEAIRITVESDADHEVHIHGYDLTEDVAAGDRVTFEFVADLAGAWDIELEDTGVKLAELLVTA